MTTLGEHHSQDQQSGRHAAAEGAERHPLIDMDRDPTPGKADHARPGEDDE
ncbi:hypothetical protein [Kutzneria kofuensis]|uniref:Uncharacterized protein n=1 Tax=Kutzneria kofuensis TaxID=103725 RepID=A0A7W9NKK0_9PSEU|nr:hypothetical protein [Kutzneria kofuensis]MBB5895343.1 hypothetical protein [Kutzneria kofuensis]